jgi:hypothetical protein
MFGVKNSRRSVCALGPIAIVRGFAPPRSFVQGGGSARSGPPCRCRSGGPDRLPRATPGQSLELDQPTDVAVEVGQGGVNNRVIDRRDGFGFPGVGPASLEPANGRGPGERSVGPIPRRPPTGTPGGPVHPALTVFRDQPALTNRCGRP